MNNFFEPERIMTAAKARSKTCYIKHTTKPRSDGLARLETPDTPERSNLHSFY